MLLQFNRSVLTANKMRRNYRISYAKRSKRKDRRKDDRFYINIIPRFNENSVDMLWAK